MAVLNGTPPSVHLDERACHIVATRAAQEQYHVTWVMGVRVRVRMRVRVRVRFGTDLRGCREPLGWLLLRQ